MQQGSTGIHSAGAFDGKQENGGASNQMNKTESLEGQRGIATNVEDADKEEKKIGKPGQRKVGGSPGQLGVISNLKDENQENIEMNGEGDNEIISSETPENLDHQVGQIERQDIEGQEGEEH